MTDTIDDIAAKHGFSPDATRALKEALRRGNNGMAQFSHPELGGTGQWTAGGMILIGDMFNHSLKARVAALCADLAAIPGPVPASPDRGRSWWPDDLGKPSATGAQNDMRYACFPDQRRLAVMQAGDVRVYDTGAHRITGFAQQQGTGQGLTFTSQSGAVALGALRPV